MNMVIFVAISILIYAVAAIALGVTLEEIQYGHSFYGNAFVFLLAIIVLPPFSVMLIANGLFGMGELDRRIDNFLRLLASEHPLIFGLIALALIAMALLYCFFVGRVINYRHAKRLARKTQ